MFFYYYFTNLFFRYKYNYNVACAPSNDFSQLESKKDDDNIDLYISNKEDNVKDELISYLKEKQANKKVSQIYLKSIK